MRIIARKPCNLGGKRYFIGEEIPAEMAGNYTALEKMGVVSVLTDETPEMHHIETGAKNRFSIPIIKGENTLELLISEAEMQEAVKTMQMPQKDAVAHIRGHIENNTVLICINALDSRSAVKKETEAKAQEIAESEEGAGDS